MAEKKYTGSGEVTADDFHAVKWVGKTKGGKAVTIEMPSAFCRSNPDWTFAEKDDTLASLEWEGAYDEDDVADGDRTEPWTITMADGSATGSAAILLGVGKFYVDGVAVALIRGGGKFTVEREYREITADGDPGLVGDRIVQETGRPKLSLTALTWLENIADIYAGMKEVTA